MLNLENDNTNNNVLIGSYKATVLSLCLLETIFAHWDHASIHKENTLAIRNVVKTESKRGAFLK